MSSNEANRSPNGRDTGKGKGREIPSTGRPTEAMRAESGEAGSRTDSMMSRVTRSTHGLLGGLLGGSPNLDDIGNIQPQAKSASSSSHPGAGHGASLGEGSSPSLQRPQTHSQDQESFRSNHVKEHITKEEEAFSAFLDGIDDSNTGHLTAASLPVEPDRQGIPGGPHSTSSVAQWEQRDGVEVVNLLSTGYDEVMTGAEEVPLSPEEKSTLQQALFGGREAAAASAGLEWDNMLNFMPEFLSQRGNDMSYVDSSVHMGVSDVREARQLWVNQWHNVLERYTDDVWGDLGSLVEEARNELEELRSANVDEPKPDLKALLRLRQILGHMRGH